MKQIMLLSAALLLCVCAAAQAPYWQPVTSGTTKKLISISFGSPQVGYISGTDSLLLRSLDGGLSWSPVSHRGMVLNAASPDIIHVNFTAAGTGYAVAGSLANPVYKGVLYKTRDSGRNWQPVNNGNIAVARSFFFDADNGYAVGAAFFAGKTIVKQTAGAWGTEHQFSYNPNEFLYGIDFHNAATGIAGGAGGYIYRTFNGGSSWDTVKLPTDSLINSLKFLSDHSIMAATDEHGGAIFISHDTGRTWLADPFTATFAYPSIKGLAVSRQDSFIAVGHASPVSSGPQGIVLWHGGSIANNQMTARALNDVAMRDNSVAYIVGDSGTILSNRQQLLGVVPATGPAPLRVYPNPAGGICHTEAGYLHTIRIYDVAGRLVLAQTQPAFRHTIYPGELCRGLYLLAALPVDGSAPGYQRLMLE